MSRELGQLAGRLLADDDQIKARIRALVVRMVDEAEELIDTAAPSIKATLIRTVIPAMLREMKEEKEDESIAALRAQLDALSQELKGTVRSRGPKVVALPTPPVDMPRPSA